MACEAAAMAEIQGLYKPEITDALLVGSYIDAVISDEIEIFTSLHPDIFSTRGETKGQLKSQYRHADYMLDRIRQDPVFMDYLTGDKQVILTCEIAGIPVKSKIDILHPARIVDFKSTKDFALVWSNGGKTNFIDFYSYDYQGAIYQENVRQKIGKRLPYYIAAVTKEPEPDMEVIHVPDHILKNRLAEIEYILPQYQAIKIGLAGAGRCGICNWCKRTKVLTGPVELDDIFERWNA